MKALIILATIAGSLASAYNTRYFEIQFSKHTEVMASEKLVSLSIEVVDSTGKLPLVSISHADKSNCSHKQTLISYSGFDLKTKTYKRVYEVQIEKAASAVCNLAVMASSQPQDQMKAARVRILPSK